MKRQHLITAAAISWLILTCRMVSAQAPVGLKGAGVTATAREANGSVQFEYALSITREGQGAKSTFSLRGDTGRCASLDQTQITVGSPNGWDGGITPGVEINWEAGHNRVDVSPGGTLQGFSLVGNVLPTLCSFQLEPFVVTTALGIPAPELEGDIPAYLAKVEATVAALSVAGTTIGPVTPPAVFDAVSFLGMILGDVQAIEELGWMSHALSSLVVK